MKHLSRWLDFFCHFNITENSYILTYLFTLAWNDSLKMDLSYEQTLKAFSLISRARPSLQQGFFPLWSRHWKCWHNTRPLQKTLFSFRIQDSSLGSLIPHPLGDAAEMSSQHQLMWYPGLQVRVCSWVETLQDWTSLAQCLAASRCRAQRLFSHLDNMWVTLEQWKKRGIYFS